jgi:alpha-tubulin suppressor-like RCC1 family protein
MFAKCAAFIYIYIATNSVLLSCCSGELYAWGMGSTGQLGTGEEEDVHTPQLIKGKQLESHFVLCVSGGGQHTVLLAKSVDHEN